MPFLPKELFRISQRRRWVIIVPFAIGLVATPFAASALLDQYRSEAMIAVTTTPTDETDAGSKPIPSLAGRLPAIRNRILSQSQLEQMIREFNLYGADRQSGAITSLVQRIRQDIDVQNAGGDLVRIAYRNHDPRIAQAVAARLASLFVAASSVAGSDAAIAERFTLTVAPTLPEKPYNQVRSTASIYGGLIGLVVGLVLAVLQERSDLGLQSEDDVRRMLGVPVLGVISLMTSEHERRTHRGRSVTRVVGIAFLLGFGSVRVLLRLGS